MQKWDLKHLELLLHGLVFSRGDEEKPNEDGLKFYDDLFDECHKYGIEPVITLSHFELPWALAKEYGGFRNRKAIDMFVKFAKVCFERYQHKVKYWMTFNEINNQADVTQHNLIQEGAVLLKEGDDAEYLMYLSAHHELVASALAVKAAHEINPDLQVGCMIGMNGVYPASPKPEDMMNALGAMHQKYWYVEVHARGHYPRHILKKFERKGYDFITEEDKKILAEGKVDYIGFSYYMSFATQYQGRNEKTFDYVPEDFVRNTYLKASDWGWQIDPLGLRWCLNWFNDRFELPMMIVENGFGAYDKKEADGTVDDQYRIDYLKEHIQAMRDAVDYDGVDLLGYTMCLQSTSFQHQQVNMINVMDSFMLTIIINMKVISLEVKRNHLIGTNTLLKQMDKNSKNEVFLILFLWYNNCNGGIE